MRIEHLIVIAVIVIPAAWQLISEHRVQKEKKRDEQAEKERRAARVTSYVCPCCGEPSDRYHMSAYCSTCRNRCRNDLDTLYIDTKRESDFFQLCRRHDVHPRTFLREKWAEFRKIELKYENHEINVAEYQRLVDQYFEEYHEYAKQVNLKAIEKRRNTPSRHDNFTVLK